MAGTEGCYIPMAKSELYNDQLHCFLPLLFVREIAGWALYSQVAVIQQIRGGVEVNLNRGIAQHFHKKTEKF